jgi:hypothetical protein
MSAFAYISSSRFGVDVFITVTRVPHNARHGVSVRDGCKRDVANDS